MSAPKKKLSVVSFASDNNYKVLRAYNFLLLKKLPYINRVFNFDAKDLDDDFLKTNYNLLQNKRGYGYWCWKPYIIKKALQELDYGDYLLYLDIDWKITKRIGKFIDYLDSTNQDLLAYYYSENHIVKNWVKRDLLKKLTCDTNFYTKSYQMEAGTIIMRKSIFIEKFLKSWGEYCQIEHLISDSPSNTPNYTGFKEHRHDQAIFSLLYKKHRLKTLGSRDKYTSEDTLLIENHRNIITDIKKQPLLVAKLLYQSPFLIKIIMINIIINSIHKYLKKQYNKRFI